MRLLDQVKDEIDKVSLGEPITYADLIQLSGNLTPRLRRSSSPFDISSITDTSLYLILTTAQSALKRTFLDAAIRKCGGNEEKGNLLYTAYGSNGQVTNQIATQFVKHKKKSQHLIIYYNLQWGLFERNFGRSDSDDPDPEGRVPIWEKASVKEMKDKFIAVGLGPRQVCLFPFLIISSIKTLDIFVTVRIGNYFFSQPVGRYVCIFGS